jgi:hypothetical protein
MSPHWKTETGAAMGKSQDSARFDLGMFSCVLCFQASSIEMEWLKNRYDLPIHVTVSGIALSTWKEAANSVLVLKRA